MTARTCPKCGSWRMSGPCYQARDTYQKERLSYTCLECGYTQYEPTLDQRTPKAVKP